MRISQDAQGVFILLLASWLQRDVAQFSQLCPVIDSGDFLSIGDGICDAENNIAACNWDGGDCCASTCSRGDICGEKEDVGHPRTCLDPSEQEAEKTFLTRIVLELYPEAFSVASVAEIVRSVDAGIAEILSDVSDVEIRSLVVLEETSEIFFDKEPSQEVQVAAVQVFQGLRCGAVLSVNCTARAEVQTEDRRWRRRLNDVDDDDDGDEEDFEGIANENDVDTPETEVPDKPPDVPESNPDVDSAQDSVSGSIEDDKAAETSTEPDVPPIDDAPEGVDPPADLPEVAPPPPEVPDVPQADLERLPSVIIDLEIWLNSTSSGDVLGSVDTESLQEEGLNFVELFNSSQSAFSVSDVYITATTAIELIEGLRITLEDTLSLQTSIDGSFDQGELVVIGVIQIVEPECYECDGPEDDASTIVSRQNLILSVASLAAALVLSLLGVFVFYRWRASHKQKAPRAAQSCSEKEEEKNSCAVRPEPLMADRV